MSLHDETINDEAIALMLAREEEEEKSRIWMDNNRELIDGSRINQIQQEEEKKRKIEIEEHALELERKHQRIREELESENLFKLYGNPMDFDNFPDSFTTSTRFSIIEASQNQPHLPQPPRINPQSRIPALLEQMRINPSERISNPPTNSHENVSYRNNSTSSDSSNPDQENPDIIRIPNSRNRRFPEVINRRNPPAVNRGRPEPRNIRDMRLRHRMSSSESSISNDEDLGSYEALLKLDDDAYDRGKGLSRKKIRLLPEDKYYEGEKADSEGICFCGEEYKNDDKICRLPCFHFFHTKCIHEWLLRRKTCPVCTREVII